MLDDKNAVLPRVKNEAQAVRKTIVRSQAAQLKFAWRIIAVLSAVSMTAMGAAAYSVSKEKTQVVAYTRDEVGFEHYLFLDTMVIRGDAVMIALKNFVQDWREVTIDADYNRKLRWRAFRRINVDISEQQRIFSLAASALPPQTPEDTAVTDVSNISVSPRILRERDPIHDPDVGRRTQWRVDWVEYKQNLSTNAPDKMTPETTHYTADVIVTTVEPTEEFPDGIRFEPMMPEMVPAKISNEGEHAPNM